MTKDINKKTFDEATKLKLEIFRMCFREWLPVFIHLDWMERIFIYDFFAGSGKDSQGNSGSPIVLLEEAMGENRMYCSKSVKNKVVFAFNEKINRKNLELQKNVNHHISECLNNCNIEECVYEHHFGNFDFKEAFSRPKVKEIFANSKYGKFVLLDQYGFGQVDNEVFQKLVTSPKTDFIFFISSFFIRRFKDHEYTQKYFQTNELNFDETKPKECHQVLANYFRNLVPENLEYYIHHFTIKKGSNYYGLIFGTGHTFGMEKFLKVCWELDKYSGESNFNINNDFEPGSLFHTETETVKLVKVKSELKDEILSGNITNNLEGMKCALKNGVPTKVFLEAITEMKPRINIDGKFNKKISNIHRLTTNDIYEFKIKE